MTVVTRAMVGLVLLAGCSSPASDEPDVSVEPDSGMSDMAVRDADDVEVDANPKDSGPDADTAPCTGECRSMTIAATVSGATAEFDRAYYGVTAPEVSNSGVWELHVEVYSGGPSGCPSQNSPTPDQTLIVTGMKLPEVPLTVNDADGLVVSLLDFAGDLTTEPVLAANGEELTWTLWNLCLDCVEGDPDGFLAFDLNAPLADGAVAGHGYATHCASLDSRK